MTANCSRLSDLRIFYSTVQYCVDKGGQDGMAELSHHYKQIRKLHKIVIPSIDRLLDAHSSLKNPQLSLRAIKHLEIAALKLANKRYEQLGKHLSKKNSPLPL